MPSTAPTARSTAPVVVLEPTVDPLTGETVYADVVVYEGHLVANDAHDTARDALTDGALLHGRPPSGTDAWSALTSARPQRPTGTPVSTLPNEVMAAADSWDAIATTLRDNERGKTANDVDLLPGGHLVVTNAAGKPAGTRSRLPNEVMAAVNNSPSEADVALLRRLDPDNVEQWTPVVRTFVAGWTFRMTPSVANPPTFRFFTFRSPADGNHWRTALLEPNMDREYGHKPHMIKTIVGGVEIPILCGPLGAARQDLAAVRTDAAKWMVYTTRKIRGDRPMFSR